VSPGDFYLPVTSITNVTPFAKARDTSAPPSFAIPITILSLFVAALFNSGQLSELLLDMLRPSFSFWRAGPL
jgi:hypothetical protein